MRQVIKGSLCSLLLIAAVGCGGTTSGPACTTNNTPCGGNIVGNWVYEEVCGLNSAMMDSACPTATYNLTPAISGSYTFNADLSFSTNITIGETGTITFPASCVGQVPCSMLDQSTTQDGLTTKLTCTGTTGQGCTCTGSETGTVTQKGTYKVEGTNVVMTETTGGVSTTAFCVQGSQLTVFGSSSSTTSTPDGGTSTTSTTSGSEYIVFSKQ